MNNKRLTLRRALVPPAPPAPPPPNPTPSKRLYELGFGQASDGSYRPYTVAGVIAALTNRSPPSLVRIDTEVSLDWEFLATYGSLLPGEFFCAQLADGRLSSRQRHTGRAYMEILDYRMRPLDLPLSYPDTVSPTHPVERITLTASTVVRVQAETAVRLYGHGYN